MQNKFENLSIKRKPQPVHPQSNRFVSAYRTSSKVLVTSILNQKSLRMLDNNKDSKLPVHIRLHSRASNQSMISSDSRASVRSDKSRISSKSYQAPSSVLRKSTPLTSYYKETHTPGLPNIKRSMSTYSKVHKGAVYNGPQLNKYKTKEVEKEGKKLKEWQDNSILGYLNQISSPKQDNYDKYYQSNEEYAYKYKPKTDDTKSYFNSKHKDIIEKKKFEYDPSKKKMVLIMHHKYTNDQQNITKSKSVNQLREKQIKNKNKNKEIPLNNTKRNESSKLVRNESVTKQRLGGNLGSNKEKENKPSIKLLKR